MYKFTAAILCLGVVLSGSRSFAQIPSPPVSVPTSVDASQVLDVAGPEQRKSLGANLPNRMPWR